MGNQLNTDVGLYQIAHMLVEFEPSALNDIFHVDVDDVDGYDATDFHQNEQH